MGVALGRVVNGHVEVMGSTNECYWLFPGEALVMDVFGLV